MIVFKDAIGKSGWRLDPSALVTYEPRDRDWEDVPHSVKESTDGTTGWAIYIAYAKGEYYGTKFLNFPTKEKRDSALKKLDSIKGTHNIG